MRALQNRTRIASFWIGSVATLFCWGSGAAAHDSLGNTGGTWDRGAVNAFRNAPQPWVRKYFSPAGQCLHLQVIQLSTPVDLEMVVVAPNPLSVYRDDDGGNTPSCSLCPRVDISPTPVEGYYSVTVMPHAAFGANAEFILEMTRDSNQANCIPTSPLSSVNSAKK
jgi:hypothetical protein